MRLSTLRIAALALLAASAAGCTRQGAPDAQPSGGASGAASAGEQAEAGPPAGKEFNGTLDIANRGQAMPDMTFTDPSGRKLSLASLKGKPVLVNLWATWCGPCVLEMPVLDKLAGDPAAGVRVVTVSQDMQGAAKVAAFFAQRKFAHLEPWVDPENELGFFYNTGTLPTTVLYDAQGKEVWRMIGAHDWSNPRTALMLADVKG